MVNGEKRYDSKRICAENGSDLHDCDPVAESRHRSRGVLGGSDADANHLAHTGNGHDNEDAEVGAEAETGKEGEGEIVRVPLSRGQFAIIDSGDADRVLAHRWCAMRAKNRRWYALRHSQSGGKTQTILLHRFIMNAAPGLQVDHVNLDALDNRRCNLRMATQSQNLCNRQRTRVNKSGFKGVIWDRWESKFRARISYNKVTYSLGAFATAEEAARAYDAAAKKLHGEFARLNFTETE